MRRQQLIQLGQFVFAWVLLWIFVVFVNESSFLEFVLRYWLYLLIVSVSYFYYYSIQYELDKKYKLIRNILLYWNLYLFTHIFFRPILNIPHELYVLLWLIILWMWWTTKMKSRWKYALQFLWWILSVFILVSWLFYLYPEKPDIDWFIWDRLYKISILWIEESVLKKEAYIVIRDSKRDNSFEIIPYFEKDLHENCEISYLSQKKNRDEKIVIMTPYGEIFQLFPQSNIRLEFVDEKVSKVSVLNGEVWFLSWVFNSDLEFLWNKKILSQYQQDWIQWVQLGYKYDLVWYLKNQISDSNVGWANGTIMSNFDWKILWYLAKMFPTTFSKNFDNYKEFQYYFSWASGDDRELTRYSGYDKSSPSFSLWDNLVGNIGIWKWNTYNPFKRF